MANGNNCGCSRNANNNGCQHGLPIGVTLSASPVDRSALGADHKVDPCDTLVAIKATVTTGALHQCDSPPPSSSSFDWKKWWPLILLGLVLVPLLLWGLVSLATSRPAGVASATAVPMAPVAQAGQPVIATASPVQYLEFNVNGAQLASAGVKPSVKPAKPAVPTKPCKAIVFDTTAYKAYGVEVASDGTNYVFTQTTEEPASPNNIAAAQAARPNGWVTVVYDPQGPYAVNHKGDTLPVKMDNMGRILVPMSQVRI